MSVFLRKKQHYSSGMTLVEVIVSLLIATVVIAMATSIIFFSTNFLSRTEVRAEDKQMAEDAADYARDRLLYAHSISVIRASEPPFGAASAQIGAASGSGNSGGELLFIGEEDTNGNIHIANSGSLYYMRAGDSRAINVLGESRYRGSKLALSYEAILNNDALQGKPTKSFRIIIKTIRDGAIVYDSAKSFALYQAADSAEPTANLAITSWSSEGGFSNATDIFSYDANAKFYLLIDPSTAGYVKADLLAHYDAIDNAFNAGLNSQAHHDPYQTTIWKDISGNGKDMQLYLTNDKPINDQSLFFDGTDDYGVIYDLDLSSYDAVTVEVCFREATSGLSGMLYEYSSDLNTNPTGFGVYLNSIIKNNTTAGLVHTNMGNESASENDPYLRPLNYKWADNSSRLTTHCNTFSMKADVAPRSVYIDGTMATLVKSGTSNTIVSGVEKYAVGRNFVSPPLSLFVASRDGTSLFYKGEIASIRVYGGVLSEEKAKQNAREDALRFGF
ncbi:MAG: prepilin-type N-terminal cleavage/methylation domain-containing protein [Coriobacteriales bacterium]|jgi:type II secretory pathway pseudopilin PulG|nr:prepilin-type N-terminal cleavage/methylation domain-containing protein [Coriobacteriales bacterium]